MGQAELVFAYGSNLLHHRIRTRVPSALPVAIGFVVCRKIVFHKRSDDGSAKADARFTADPNDRTWGVVYRLSASDKLVLDAFESLGVGYDQVLVGVETGNGSSIRAWMYVARQQAIAESLMPYSWYLEFVVRGARENRLPFCYVATLSKLDSIVDPDDERRRNNWAILDLNQRSRGY